MKIIIKTTIAGELRQGFPDSELCDPDLHPGGVDNPLYKRLESQSDHSYISDIMVQHLARPQLDPRKQIALRKARDAARKAKLTTLRRS
ncbi:MAG: hypothetical protein O9353_14385 [Bacteroidia bacterium]|nr:hypothetical protein [Bacteroidia bacterium]